MKVKDLFNAINDIDEKYIADAGEYLTTGSGVSPQYGETIEVCAVERKLSPLKIAASIAAAAVLVFGAAAVLKMQSIRNINNVASGEADSAFALTSAAISANSAGVLSSQIDGNEAWTSNSKAGVGITGSAQGNLEPENEFNDAENAWHTEVLRTIIAPDGYSIPTKNVETYYDGSTYSVLCKDLVYVGMPTGENYNNIDTPNAFEASLYPQYNTRADCFCMMEGDVFGDLTVSSAKCEISCRYENPNSLFYKYGYVAFDGEISANVYIVKDEYDDYYLVFRPGEQQIPTMNIPQYYNAARIDDQEYYYNAQSIGDFLYATELPAIQLDESTSRGLDYFFLRSSYREAVVTLSNISMCGHEGGLELYANVVQLSLLPTDDVPDSENEIGIINNLVYINELQMLFHEVRVYPDKDCYINQTSEVTEGELVPGMIVEVFDKNGNNLVTQTYRGDEVNY